MGLKVGGAPSGELRRTTHSHTHSGRAFDGRKGENWDWASERQRAWSLEKVVPGVEQDKKHSFVTVDGVPPRDDPIELYRNLPLPPDQNLDINS